MRRFLRLAEVAAETGMALGTVRSWVHERRLASVKLGRRRLVARTDLEAFIARSRTEARPALPGRRVR